MIDFLAAALLEQASGGDAIDEAVRRHLEGIGCTAAQVAVAKGGRLLLSRAYGWSDEQRRVRTTEATLFGIASCEKPIANAAMRRLASLGKIDLDSPLIPLYGIESVVDVRYRRITVRHLLEHKAGWGKDPIGILPIDKRLPFDQWSTKVPELLSSLSATLPLSHDPGEVAEYCNFGFDVVRDLITRTGGRHYIDFYRSGLLKRGLADGFFSPYHPTMPKPKDAVWNATAGGPVWSNAKTLLGFMGEYWLNGELRKGEAFHWQMNGSLDGSTALMVWRPDGIDYVILFNGRKSSQTHEELRKSMDSAVNDTLR